jgi:hypothetical protein
MMILVARATPGSARKCEPWQTAASAYDLGYALWQARSRRKAARLLTPETSPGNVPAIGRTSARDHPAPGRSALPSARLGPDPQPCIVSTGPADSPASAGGVFAPPGGAQRAPASIRTAPSRAARCPRRGCDTSSPRRTASAARTRRRAPHTPPHRRELRVVLVALRVQAGIPVGLHWPCPAGRFGDQPRVVGRVLGAAAPFGWVSGSGRRLPPRPPVLPVRHGYSASSSASGRASSSASDAISARASRS